MIDISTLKRGDKVKIISLPQGVDGYGMERVGLSVGGYGYVLTVSRRLNTLVSVGAVPELEDKNGITAWNFRAEHLDSSYEYNVNEWTID